MTLCSVYLITSRIVFEGVFESLKEHRDATKQ